MGSVFMIMDIGDPYEPGFPLAICSSLEKCTELFDNLWVEHPDKITNDRGKTIYVNLTTKEERAPDNLGCPPTPYIEEIVLNKLITENV